MTFDEYQKAAIRTINPKLSRNDRLDMLALGLCGESGECADHVKKWRWHDHPELDKAKLAKEIGDVSWYLAGVASTLDFTLSEAIQQVVEHYTSMGEHWMYAFDPNSISDLQRGVELYEMVLVEKRGTLAQQLSEETHHLCRECVGLAHRLTTLALIEDPDEGEKEAIRSCVVCAMMTCAAYSTILGLSFEQVLTDNVAKLRLRYPDGFSAERSVNRAKEE